MESNPLAAVRIANALERIAKALEQIAADYHGDDELLVPDDIAVETE